MKRVFRKLARSCGLEITRYRPSSSCPAQLAKAIEFGRIDVVFDVGANVGQFGNGIREYGYTGNIISFEPLTAAREKLVLLAGCDPNWIVHEQCAIGDHEGEIEVNISGNSVSSSVLPMLESHSSASVGSGYIASERVPICRLDSIATPYLQTETNLFIKIDTQGYEWQVLDGASEALQRARGVLCELSLVPLYEGQRLWRDIIDRLEAEGFVLWALQKGFTDPWNGQSLQMDGIFLRRDVLQRSRLHPMAGARCNRRQAWSSPIHHVGHLHDWLSARELCRRWLGNRTSSRSRRRHSFQSMGRRGEALYQLYREAGIASRVNAA